jgi:hypothetical protein
MSKTDDERRRELLKSWAEARYNENPAAATFDSSLELRRWIVNHIGPDTPATYLEFGVAHGDSMRYFSECFRHPDSRFIGFDSFLGLPDAWLHLPKFHFDRRGNAPTSDDPRVLFVKGWFQNVVPPFLATWQPQTGTVFIHFDADLYGSTLFAMTMLWSSLPTYYFLCDDFLQDDAVALFDFASAYPVAIEFLAQAGRDGHGTLRPVQVFGRLRNTEFRVESA